jgi:hypothetical protein
VGEASSSTSTAGAQTPRLLLAHRPLLAGGAGDVGAVDDHVPAVEVGHGVADRGAPEEAVVLPADDVAVGEHAGDVGALGAPRRDGVREVGLDSGVELVPGEEVAL